VLFEREVEQLEDLVGDEAENEYAPVRYGQMTGHLVLPEDLTHHALRNAEQLGDLRVGVVVGLQR
jgi:hypothetical protein